MNGKGISDLFRLSYCHFHMERLSKWKFVHSCRFISTCGECPLRVTVRDYDGVPVIRPLAALRARPDW